MLHSSFFVCLSWVYYYFRRHSFSTCLSFGQKVHIRLFLFNRTYKYKKTGQNQVTQERRGEVLSTSPKFDVSNRQSILSLSLSENMWVQPSQQADRQQTFRLTQKGWRMCLEKREDKEKVEKSASLECSPVYSLWQIRCSVFAHFHSDDLPSLINFSGYCH